jgi:hypothetical protein
MGSAVGRLRVKAYPSQAEVKELLDYDPSTGNLYWLPRPNTSGPNKCFNRKFAGKVAGTVRRNTIDADSVLVRIYKKTYHASHLIFVYMGKKRPEVIGFRDGNPLNLRWSNLTTSNLKEVAKRRKEARISKTGVKWIYFEEGRYKVRIKRGTNKKRYGSYSSLEEAKEVLDKILENE